MTKDELDRIAKALDEIKNLANLYCTGCEYCLPCPMNINIPHLFRIMNYHKVYGMTAYAQELYMNIGKNEREGSRPTECSECGSCESKCPQNIEIRKQLKEIIEVLGE